MVCVYCGENYDDPALFRAHNEQEHQEFQPEIALFHLKDISCDVKVDCTDLRCRLCFNSFENIDDVAKHIHKDHNISINLEVDLGVLPFKIHKDKYFCIVCNKKFPNIRYLSKHTNTHFVKHTCEYCGNSYASTTALGSHIRYRCSRQSRLPFCRKCKMTFNSLKERMRHMESSKSCCPRVCNICFDRFPTSQSKQRHMMEKHDEPVTTFPCPECGMVFKKRDAFRQHYVLTHTEDHFPCAQCDQKFSSQRNLKKHLVLHSGEKLFECNVCNKSFKRKSGLNQHQWIHAEVKKHSCHLCDKHFNQRVCWKSHMRSRHPELCDF